MTALLTITLFLYHSLSPSFNLTNEKQIMKDAGLFQQGDIHR